MEFIKKFDTPKASPKTTASLKPSPTKKSTNKKSSVEEQAPSTKSTKKTEKEEKLTEDKQEGTGEEEDSENGDEEAAGAEEASTSQLPETITTKHSDFIKSLSGDSLKLYNEIYSSCATNNVAKLKQLFDDRVHSKRESEPLEAETQSLLVESLLNKRLNAELGFCLLHVISQLGYAECVWILLENGANPAMSDLTKQRRVPYLLSLNKSTRDTYRRFECLIFRIS